MDCDCIAVPDRVHPLDGTPVAGLRPAGELEPTPWGVGNQMIWETDWPALAEIAAYLDLSGQLYEWACCRIDPTPDEACLLVAADNIRDMGGLCISGDHDDPLWMPAESLKPWLDDPGLWTEVHAYAQWQAMSTAHEEYALPQATVDSIHEKAAIRWAAHGMVGDSRRHDHSNPDWQYTCAECQRLRGRGSDG